MSLWDKEFGGLLGFMETREFSSTAAQQIVESYLCRSKLHRPWMTVCPFDPSTKASRLLREAVFLLPSDLQ